MKLIRLKITDPRGFRSLQPGFEYRFRSEWTLQDELGETEFSDGFKPGQGFAPFVCAGPNGSGKSNLLESLAAIFFQLEVLRVRRSFLPSAFIYDEEENPEGFREGDGFPKGFELDYLIPVPKHSRHKNSPLFATVEIQKLPDQSPKIIWSNFSEFNLDDDTLKRLESNKGLVGANERDDLLPAYVLGYSSGENEILSLPFFKMRFIQFDEYRHSLTRQLSYPGRPETRMAYMDASFSQAILLCNLLYHDADTLKPFQADMGLKDLQEFRIIIKRSIHISAGQAEGFGNDHPAVFMDSDAGTYTLNLIDLLEADQDSAKGFDPPVTRLKRCATCYFTDESTDTLYLDYCVNDHTKRAFKQNFDSAIDLFHAFQVLLTLNLYPVSERLKADLYQSNSHYVSETVPVLASDERIMRFKFVRFKKDGINTSVILKDLSDGEHQLLHSLGLCLLFKDTNSLFLLDEPETHFNPAWRANFISRFRDCFHEGKNPHKDREMLITTHAPFLVSDSEPHKVLVFDKDKDTGNIRISHPDYNTLGASINRITIETFEKRETIGGYAQSLLNVFREEFRNGRVDLDDLLRRIDRRLGDSVEKMLLMKTIEDSGRVND